MITTIADAALTREVAFLNARAAAIAARPANAALAEFGLKVRSYSVLSLAAEQSPPSQRELADLLQLDPSQIVALVDDLESRGLVSRVADSADRRIKVIVATPEGARVARQAALITRRVEDASLAMLDDDERALLVALLQKVALGA